MEAISIIYYIVIFLYLIIFLVDLGAFLHLAPLTRILKNIICRDYYAQHNQAVDMQLEDCKTVLIQNGRQTLAK